MEERRSDVARRQAVAKALARQLRERALSSGRAASAAADARTASDLCSATDQQSQQLRTAAAEVAELPVSACSCLGRPVKMTMCARLCHVPGRNW